MPARQVHEIDVSRSGRTRRKLPCAVLLALALHGAGAHADTADTPLLNLSGFGSLGVVHSSESRADFIANSNKPKGAGFSNQWSADVDSLVGAQITVNPTSRLSAVLQVIAEQNYDNSYRPHVEWANIRYAFTPDFSIRIGRTVFPTFLTTDTRKVGYSYPWVRLPLELYNLMPVTTNDGVDASYRMNWGSASNTFQLVAGQSDSKYPASRVTGPQTANARDVVAMADTFEMGAATVHFNYGRARLTIAELAPLFNGFRQFGAQGVALADKYDVNHRLFTFMGVGANYDPGAWFLIGEWGRIDTNSVLGKNTGWYVGGGYRLGKFTPFASYGQIKTISNTSDPGLTVSALPPFLAGAASGLNTGLNSILGSRAVQNTASVGGRWDFARNMAFKLQFDHTRHGAGSAGTLSNTQPNFQTGGKVNVISAKIDFVF